MTGDFVQRLREEDRAGFRALDDLALAHFCDSDQDSRLPLEIDGVYLPRAQMGRMAVRLLIDRIEGRGPSEPLTIKVTPEFRPGGAPRDDVS